MRIDERQTSRVSPDWSAYPQSGITDQELKQIDHKRAYNSIYRDTLSTLDTEKVSRPTSATASIASSPMEKKLYGKDTLSTYRGEISQVPRPSLGVHPLQKPEERSNPTPQKKAADELSLPIKTATTAGFFNQIKNFFYNLLGWGVAPTDPSAETPLTGSPKEVQLSERDCEAIIKALEQMSLAINKLITKPSEESKEGQADDSSRETELLQLKQLKNEVQILKEVLEVIREEVKSKDLDAVLSTEEISKNQDEHKELQAKHLANLEDIEARLKTSKLLNWVQIGAMGMSTACLIIGAALILSNPATIAGFGAAYSGLAAASSASQILAALGAGAASIGTGAATAAASSGSLTLSLLGSTATVVQGGATGIKAHQQYETGVKRSENESINDRRRHLKSKFETVTANLSKSLSKTNQIHNALAMIPKSKAETIRYIAMQINR